VAVIPARYASTRFPGKPLANETGKYLIQHVYERTLAARTIERAIVATDDRRILDAVRSFGGEAAMTRADHPSGTDRVAEVAADLDAALIVNVQGDEPELEPAFIDRLVERMVSDADCAMGTLACPFAAIPSGNPDDPNAVKVIVDQAGRAMCFSRSRIPYPAATLPEGSDLVRPPYLHLGIYAYRREFLMELASLRPTPLELTERLEQLRALEHGYRIAVVLVDQAAVGVDTPEDYAAFVERAKESEPQR
jgi:3-deoxy-manno-octulosonate cytidylyltransferase (CMP-KDO synthetase)